LKKANLLYREYIMGEAWQYSTLDPQGQSIGKMYNLTGANRPMCKRSRKYNFVVIAETARSIQDIVMPELAPDIPPSDDL
jgi:hypothetical protein